MDRVEIVFGVKGPTRLARALEIPQGRVEGWYARQSPDIAFILDKVADRRDVDIAWLLTGKVTTEDHNRRVAQLEGQIQPLKDMLTEANKAAVLVAAREACSTVVSELRASPPVREGLSRDVPAAGAGK